MSQYNQSSGGSDEMYSDAAPAEPKPEAEDGKKEDKGETALIPKSLCPDMKPGDEVVLKIERGLEDDWEVSYAPKKKESPEPVSAPPQGGEMSSMME